MNATTEPTFDDGYLAKPAPLPDPERAARDALMRHQCVRPLDKELHRAAVEYATEADHGREHLCFDEIVDLRVSSPLLRNAVAYAASEGLRQADRMRLEADRQRRILLVVTRMLAALDIPAGHPHLAVAVNNIRLAAGSSGQPDHLDRYLRGLNDLIGQVPGAPADNQGETP